jgi:acyl-CoA thioesterase FadM
LSDAVANPQRIEHPYRVRFDEAGGDGQLRSSGYLRFAQDLAWIHSETAGFGREWYGERQLTWLVRGVELDILDDVEYGGEIVVTTQVIGFRRVVARRRTEIHLLGSERTIAVAITDWVLLNGAGRPIRPPDEILDAFVGTSEDFTALRVRLGDAPPNAARVGFVVRRSETDPMDHVNNAAYIDYVDEQLAASLGAARLPTPRRYRAEFVGSAVAGSAVTATTWNADLAWHCLLSDGGGRDLLRASVETDPGLWVGG